MVKTETDILLTPVYKLDIESSISYINEGS